MNGTLAILLVPLAAGLVVTLWNLWRDREPRLLLGGLLLPALAVRHFAMSPVLADSVAELIATPYAAGLALELGINTAAAALVVMLARSLRERNRAERVQWDSMESVRALVSFLAEHRGALEEGLPDLLALGCRRLGFAVGAYGRIDDDLVTLVAVAPESGAAVKPGDTFRFQDTLCHAALEADAPLAVERLTGSHWAASVPEHVRVGFESYLGATVRAEERAIGTLFFASQEPRSRRFSGVDKQLLSLMAEWLGGELERVSLARHAARSEERAAAAIASRPAPTLGSGARLIPRRGEALDRRRLDVNAALSQLEDELRQPLGDANRLRLDLDPGNPIARLHRHEFDRVLYSLFWQAVELAESAERLRVATATPDVPEGVPATPFATLTIEADGRGLDAAGVHALFVDRSSQAPIASREGRLSLPRARRLLHANGGDLSVHSDPERGTTFTAYLPLFEDEAAGRHDELE